MMDCLYKTLLNYSVWILRYLTPLCWTKCWSEGIISKWHAFNHPIWIIFDLKEHCFYAIHLWAAITTLSFYIAVMSVTSSVNLHSHIVCSNFLLPFLNSIKAQVISLLNCLFITTISQMESKTALILSPTRCRLYMLVPRTQILFGSVLFISQYKAKKMHFIYC